jgi:hypothetical protein
MPVKNKRGYTVIYLGAIRPSQLGKITAKKALHFTGVNGHSVDVAPGQSFYLAPSDSHGDGYFYIVLCDVYGAKKCSCPANKPCKHEIALSAKVATQPSLRNPIVVSRETPRRVVEDWGDLGTQGQLTKSPAFSLLR